MGESKQNESNNKEILADSNELVIEIVRPKSDLPTWNKICFAAAGLPFQMYSSALGFFVNIFFLDRAKLTPDDVLLVLLISRHVINRMNNYMFSFKIIFLIFFYISILKD